MKKVALFFSGITLLFSQLLIADSSGHLSNQFWVVFRADIQKISIRKDADVIKTGLPVLDATLKRHRVVAMRQEMPNARPGDRQGGFLLANVYRLEISPLADLKTAIRDFAKVPAVLLAENIPVAKIFDSPTYTPNDPLFLSQWAPQKVRSPEAWGLWNGIPPAIDSVTIAIFDSGVEWDHPDLIANIWVNPGEDIDGDGLVGEYDSLANGGDLNGIDDDNNGYVDDLVGWDFCGATIGDPNNPTFLPDNDPHSSLAGGVDGWLMHGTHVSGCASAATDNKLGVASPGFNARIMPIKFAFDDDLSHATQGIYEQPAAYLYAAQNGADIINCSYGYDMASVVVENTIATIYNVYDCIIVAAAGNEGNTSLNYPAAYEHVIAVAATGRQDVKATFSSYGSFVDLSAPGENVLSTVYHNVGNGYQSLSGTSMASPTAAGAFAILKAFFPDQNNSWLESRMIAAADNIDVINPNFAGQLGSGRVNIFRAISEWIHPQLTMQNDSLVINDENNDGQLTPGESASVYFTLENNSINNIDAEMVTALLRTSHPGVTITDSIAIFPDLMNGTSATNEGDPFSFELSPEIAIGDVSFQIVVFANPNDPYPYETCFDLVVSTSINQVGWPRVEIGNIKNSAIITDLEGDGDKDLIAASTDGNLYAWQFDGSLLNGFPVSGLGEVLGSPALGDVDNNGDNEIVLVSRNGYLYIVRNDGGMLAMANIQQDLRGTPSLADLDNNGDLEIIFASYTGVLHVKNHDGSDWGNFPVNFGLGSRVTAGVALGDINDDLVTDLVFGSLFGDIYAVSSADATTLPGFPVDLGAILNATPTIADFDESGPLPVQIVVCSRSGMITILNGNGAIAATHDFMDIIDASPVLADLDSDGNPEIVFGTGGKNLYAIEHNGAILNGFPVITGGSIVKSAAIADLNNSGIPEITVACNDQKLYILNHDGTHFNGSPIDIGVMIASVPTIDDVDGDGDLEIAAGTAGAMHLYDIAETGSNQNYWFTDQGNYRRTGNWQDVVTGLEPLPVNGLPKHFALHQNYPNPFNPITTIAFSIPVPGQVRLVLYNVLGEQVAVITEGKYPAGNFQLSWQADQHSSGIYFYHLHMPGKPFSAIRKMVLLK